MGGRNKRGDERRDVDLDGDRRTGGGPAGRFDYQGVQEIIMPSDATTIYTCPMHPEVQQDHPGGCPKCGMALEPKTVTAGTDDDENAELRDMTKRLWFGAALALPVFGLSMAHLIPALARQSWVDSRVLRWVQFALATLVVGWAGWPLLHRGWRSIVTRHLNMLDWKSTRLNS